MLITDMYNNETVQRNYDVGYIYQYLRLMYATNNSETPIDAYSVTPGKRVEYDMENQYDVLDALFKWFRSRLVK